MADTHDPTKRTIQTAYGKIVSQTEQNGPEWQRTQICKPIFSPIADLYPQKMGYEEEANLGLGCGFPVETAQIQAGETVLDLGCAAGIDSFLARAAVGESGRVIGIDLTPELVQRATSIAQKRGFQNTEFRCADIEYLPIPGQSVDVVISNGVFSLLSDRKRVFQEIKRVLKPGGRFCVFDLVRKTDLPAAEIEQVLQFTGCLNGIFHAQEYLEGIAAAGLEGGRIVSERAVLIPLGDGRVLEGFWAIGFCGRW